MFIGKKENSSLEMLCAITLTYIKMVITSRQKATKLKNHILNNRETGSDCTLARINAVSGTY